MTKIYKEELGQKIRKFREEAGLSRKALAKESGVPMSSIERYEYGQQEPSASRLQSLADALKVSFSEFLPEEVKTESPETMALETPNALKAESNEDPDAADDESGVPFVMKEIEESVTVPIKTSIDKEGAENISVTQLNLLDLFRKQNFVGYTRKALAVIDDLRFSLRFLEPDELQKLAIDRGLTREVIEPTSIFDLMEEDMEEAQRICIDVQERIIDTAVLGYDLWSVDFDKLIATGNQLDEEGKLERPFFWADHKKAVPIIRLALRINTLID